MSTKPATESRFELTKNKQTVMSKAQLIEDEMQKREHFQYMNKKYIQTMSKNPVLVTPSLDVKSIDMLPRVNILEDLQFRKALPKSFKLFDKGAAPFSNALDKIQDNKKFMSSLSNDMLRTAVARDSRYFKDKIKDEKVVKENMKLERDRSLGRIDQNGTDEEDEKSRPASPLLNERVAFSSEKVDLQ